MNISHTTGSPSAKPAMLRVGLGGVTSLQAWKATHSRQVPAAGNFKLELLHLFRWTSLITVMGQVKDLKLNWCGQQCCTLHTTIGDLQLQANRETLPPQIGNDSWVQVKIRLRRGLTDPELSNTSLISVSVVKVHNGDPTTAWVPTVPNDRREHMRRLRLLLSKLEPALQALFMTVMVHDQMQQRFLSRIAAIDHHCYPGGLFDCSVKAAELVYQQKHFSHQERGTAALVCLLFDIGKVSDELYRSDRLRCETGLEPHPNTARLLKRELDTMALFDSALVAALRSLLAPVDWTEWVAPPGITPTLKQCVHQALKWSWAFDRPGKDFCTDMGEKKMSDDKLDPLFTQDPLPAAPTGDVLDCATRPPVKCSVEWAAGFADGEGCIYIFKQRYKNPRRKATYRLGFCITQNHLETLALFRLSTDITQTLSKVKPRPGLTRQVYTLNLTGKSALRLITLLHPYLVRKQLEAEAAFDYWREAMGGKHPGRKGWSAEVIAKREHYFQKMKALK